MINIKELVAMYAPTVLMAISVIMNYLKTFKELKKNVSNIENSKVLTETKKEVSELKEQLSRQAKENLEMKVLQMELINELKHVQKYKISAHSSNDKEKEQYDTDKEIKES